MTKKTEPRNATNTFLLWNPKTGDVRLEPWPETARPYGLPASYWESLSDRLPDSTDYGYHDLCCTKERRKASFKERSGFVFTQAMHLIVRDGIDPQRLHHLLLELDEYRNVCSFSMPGIDQADIVFRGGRYHRPPPKHPAEA